jgi:hypothetical protein
LGDCPGPTFFKKVWFHRMIWAFGGVDRSEGTLLFLTPMESTNPSPPPNPETFFLELLATSVNEARETGPAISSPHESYALLLEKLESYWREVRHRRDPEVLLDLLVALATQCVTAADDLYVRQVIDENDSSEVA